MLEPSSFPFSRALYAPPPLRGARKSAKRLIYTQFMRPRNNSLLSLSYVCVKTVIMCVCVCVLLLPHVRTRFVAALTHARAKYYTHARTQRASQQRFVIVTRRVWRTRRDATGFEMSPHKTVSRARKCVCVIYAMMGPWNEVCVCCAGCDLTSLHRSELNHLRASVCVCVCGLGVRNTANNIESHILNMYVLMCAR